jgi:two-component system phosphate regulon response regulator OmpR
MSKPHILAVDDDERLRSLLKRYLSEQGFMISAARDAAQARRLLACFEFDLIVLDVMMPGESGLDLLASLPAGRPPALMLSAMGEARDRIKGLETGADDYLAKPFEPRELVLRLRAVLKRRAEGEAKIMGFGEYRFDTANGILKRGKKIVNLTSGEVAMLKVLTLKSGAPVSREELARAMPGASSERSIDVQVTRLRKKIEDSEGRPMHLQTVRGQGYVLYARALAPEADA